MGGAPSGWMAVLSRLGLSGLWLHSGFLRLWAGQSVSLLGSSITFLALPLTAVGLLGVGPFEMGLLGMAGRLPFLLFGLPAGVWVDRLHRRRILIATNLGQALLLGSIPVAAVFDLLTVNQLYVVAFSTGAMTVFFDIAYMTYLPELVEREHLVDGNSKLATSDSLASVAGPSIGGWLVQLVTAPIAIAVDVISFLVASACLIRISEPEPRKASLPERPSFRSELVEGLRALLSHRVLRDCAAATAILNLFGSIQVAVYVLFLAGDVRLDPATIGGLYAVFGVGGVIGAHFADRMRKRFGFGGTLVGTTTVAGLGLLAAPLAYWFPSSAIPLLALSQALFGIMLVVYNVNMLSLRQSITPEKLLGRVTATTRFITWGTMPVGALVGGSLGAAFGLAPTLVIAAMGTLLAPVWLLFSPIRAARASGSTAAPAEIG